MLSYRHGFHAGNHADVLKHITLMLITKAFCKKEKPFVYFDTHAGAALYALDDAWAKQTEEAQSGIIKLLENQENPLSIITEYTKFCKELYTKHCIYPGSPAIVSRFARENDQLVLMELHPTEIENLKASVKTIKHSQDFICKNIHVHNRNGFEGITSLTPPKQPLSARGFVLIDPSYETDNDYIDVTDTVIQIERKWKNASIAIWYPLLQRREAETERMKDAFSVRGFETLNAELCVCKKEPMGLYGSGMLIINPPYKLNETLEPILNQLCSMLAQDSDADYKLTYSGENS